MTRRLTILYEDKAEGPVKNYGPHSLLIQAVCDSLGKNAWELKDKITPIPLNGSGNVRKECKRESGRFLGGDGLVFAVYDSDRIGQLVGLGQAACKQQLKAALRGECAWREKLEVVFLERNIETLLEAVCECDPSIPEGLRKEATTGKPRPLERDAILNRAASANPAAREVRDSVRRRVPSFDYLVRKVAAAWMPPAPAP